MKRSSSVSNIIHGQQITGIINAPNISKPNHHYIDCNYFIYLQFLAL
jgi:hypothetical protein